MPDPIKPSSVSSNSGKALSSGEGEQVRRSARRREKRPLGPTYLRPLFPRPSPTLTPTASAHPLEAWRLPPALAFALQWRGVVHTALPSSPNLGQGVTESISGDHNLPPMCPETGAPSLVLPQAQSSVVSSAPHAETLSNQVPMLPTSEQADAGLSEFGVEENVESPTIEERGRCPEIDDLWDLLEVEQISFEDIEFLNVSNSSSLDPALSSTTGGSALPHDPSSPSTTDERTSPTDLGIDNVISLIDSEDPEGQGDSIGDDVRVDSTDSQRSMKRHLEQERSQEVSLQTSTRSAPKKVRRSGVTSPPRRFEKTKTVPRTQESSEATFERAAQIKKVVERRHQRQIQMIKEGVVHPLTLLSSPMLKLAWLRRKEIVGEEVIAKFSKQANMLDLRTRLGLEESLGQLKSAMLDKMNSQPNSRSDLNEVAVKLFLRAVVHPDIFYAYDRFQANLRAASQCPPEEAKTLLCSMFSLWAHERFLNLTSSKNRTLRRLLKFLESSMCMVRSNVDRLCLTVGMRKEILDYCAREIGSMLYALSSHSYKTSNSSGFQRSINDFCLNAGVVVNQNYQLKEGVEYRYTSDMLDLVSRLRSELYQQHTLSDQGATALSLT
jgi:hypothetical protein